MLTGEATTNVGADSLLTVALDKQLNLCSRVAACVLTGNLFPTSSLLLHYLHEEVENLFLGMTRLLYSDCRCCQCVVVQCLWFFLFGEDTYFKRNICFPVKKV